MSDRTKVAAYIRVSTQEQKLHGYSLDAQRQRLQDYADKHDMTIVEWYADEGVSGRCSIKKRPALMKMGADAQTRKFNVMLFIKLDRFFRSVKEYYEFEKLSNETPWIAIDEPMYDLTTSAGRLNVNLRLSIAQMEAEQTAERERMVIDYKIKQGLALAGNQSLPYGFIVKDKRVVHDPEAEDTVMRIIEHFESSQNLCETTAWIREFAGGVVKYRGLRSLLKSTLLCGEFHDNLAYTDPYIDKERWNRLQSIVASRSKIYTNKHKSDRRIYLFNGLLTCPTCGHALTGTTHGKYDRPVYRCNNYLHGKECSYSTCVFQGTLEKGMLAWLDNSLFDMDTPSTKGKAIKSVPTRSREKVTAEIDRLNYSWQKGRIKEADYDAQYDTLMAELAALDIKPTEKILNIPDNWQEIYADLSPMGRRSFWRSFVKHIEYKNVPRGKRPTHIITDVVVL